MNNYKLTYWKTIEEEKIYDCNYMKLPNTKVLLLYIYRIV